MDCQELIVVFSIGFLFSVALPHIDRVMAKAWDAISPIVVPAARILGKGYIVVVWTAALMLSGTIGYAMLSGILAAIG